MDRFNLVCAREWSHSFETLAEEKTVKDGKTSWYCMVCATITVFGISKPDIGESTAPTRAAAEMNARAQAYKRAGRWFGPGQCLYAAYEIIMFRGKNADELRIPAGDKGYLRPYFDRQGQGQKYVRGRYQHWLSDTGEEVYGEPLNHLKIAEAIQARISPRAAVQPWLNRFTEGFCQCGQSESDLPLLLSGHAGGGQPLVDRNTVHRRPQSLVGNCQAQQLTVANHRLERHGSMKEACRLNFVRENVLR